MPLLPEPVLRAAVRWLEHLPASSAARCRALFTAHGEFSDVTPTQYEAAYTWLRETGLLNNLHGGPAVQHRIFEAALLSSDPPWLRDADILVRGPHELPEDALRAAAALGIGEDHAYKQVKAVWGKVDSEERKRIGTEGELALVELLTGSVTAPVEHVAAQSDSYGYDVAVHAPGNPLHIEAKSTTRRIRLTVYLSRNEYETMLRDPAWHLVAVRLTERMEIAAIVSIPRTWIASHAPRDQGTHGRWEACRLDIPSSVSSAGISALSPTLIKNPHHYWTGLSNGWADLTPGAAGSPELAQRRRAPALKFLLADNWPYWRDHIASER